MTQSLAITAIGADRPGIVNELTEALLDAGLNIEDSRMSILGGEFAMIILVSGEQAAHDKLNARKQELEHSLKLNLLIRPTSSSRSDRQKHYKIHVEGMDNPGIVHKLARYLSQQQINIVNMQTDWQHAAHTGTPMFAVSMQVDIPADKNITQIEDEFSKLCDEMNMDVCFSKQ
ncbi:MAG TPA: ACT domain-containing protein [Gammaproteobacteria bacterium]